VVCWADGADRALLDWPITWAAADGAPWRGVKAAPAVVKEIGRQRPSIERDQLSNM